MKKTFAFAVITLPAAWAVDGPGKNASGVLRRPGLESRSLPIQVEGSTHNQSSTNGQVPRPVGGKIPQGKFHRYKAQSLAKEKIHENRYRGKLPLEDLGGVLPKKVRNMRPDEKVCVIESLKPPSLDDYKQTAGEVTYRGEGYAVRHLEESPRMKKLKAYKGIPSAVKRKLRTSKKVIFEGSRSPFGGKIEIDSPARLALIKFRKELGILEPLSLNVSSSWSGQLSLECLKKVPLRKVELSIEAGGPEGALNILGFLFKTSSKTLTALDLSFLHLERWGTFDWSAKARESLRTRIRPKGEMMGLEEMSVAPNLSLKSIKLIIEEIRGQWAFPALKKFLVNEKNILPAFKMQQPDEDLLSKALEEALAPQRPRRLHFDATSLVTRTPNLLGGVSWGSNCSLLPCIKYGQKTLLEDAKKTSEDENQKGGGKRFKTRPKFISSFPLSLQFSPPSGKTSFFKGIKPLEVEQKSFVKESQGALDPFEKPEILLTLIENLPQRNVSSNPPSAAIALPAVPWEALEDQENAKSSRPKAFPSFEDPSMKE